jgi:nicotinamide-nucleotide amidase
MNKTFMPSAEILTIGTEILLGEILDTNARQIAISLRENGFDLFRKTTVGDNTDRIAQAIQEALMRSEIIITTGGLGPTVDDPTREAVALATGVRVEFRPELWEQIQDRFRRYNRQPTENNRRQAYIPQGAIAVENPVGTAPAFIVEIGNRCVISLPGVPSEMEHLLQHMIIPYLLDRYQIHSLIKMRILHTAGIGESQIDDLMGDLEFLSNPTVGLAAHSGQVDVRIVAKAENEVDASNAIKTIEDELRKRLGDWVYGADQETLEYVALTTLETIGWHLAVVESGTLGELTRRLASVHKNIFCGGQVLIETPTLEDLKVNVDSFRQEQSAQIGLGIAIYPEEVRQHILIWLVTPDSTKLHRRPYGGPPEYAPRWAVNHSLDLIRRLRKEP